ncbi:hypothetical protein [Pseudomonas sp. CC6-YY-74]|uniref:hypothetical protein n=1 Tax=Pseudomonas sp. CC6-YY-74 TaxID=1930532 RepID=UPI0009A15381|nr:hypothetical protein [Pseudomonas sp. CC6-YY-74]
MNIDANACKVCEGGEVFLHLSKEAPRKRLLARIDESDKTASSASPAAPSTLRDTYVQAYGHALGATSTAEPARFLVPADDKHDARLIVSHDRARRAGRSQV